MEKWERNVSEFTATAEEISSGKLRHSGLCEPVEVDIFATCEKIYSKCILGVGKSSTRKLFDLSFIWKIKTPPSSYRSSKYISGQVRQYGTTKPGDIISR